MTAIALLTADEAARLRPGEPLVIVRPGEPHPMSGHDAIGHPGPFVAPQDWVALTGPCPTCDKRAEELHDAYEAAAAVEGWATQERSRKPWADVPEANKRTMWVAIRQVFGCPDCRDGHRIVPLYTECQTCFGNPMKHLDLGYCPKCGPPRGLRLVGRGSIEVVPVVDGWDFKNNWDVEENGPALLVFDPPYTDESGEVWTAALYLRWGEYVNVTLDSKSIAGQWFGIVIHCTEVVS